MTRALPQAPIPRTLSILVILGDDLAALHKLAGMFIVILGAVLGLMQLYLWKRLVKDTTRPGRARRILTAVLSPSRRCWSRR